VFKSDPLLSLVSHTLLSSHTLASLTLLCVSILWQHFGYEFNYTTLLLDRTANLRAVPSEVMGLLQAKLASEGVFEEEARRVNQLTINEYYPGQGIATHVGL
jgi:hypothetical protein